jgi:hypothetical protein
LVIGLGESGIEAPRAVAVAYYLSASGFLTALVIMAFLVGKKK